MSRSHSLGSAIQSLATAVIDDRDGSWCNKLNYALRTVKFWRKQPSVEHGPERQRAPAQAFDAYAAERLPSNLPCFLGAYFNVQSAPNLAQHGGEPNVFDFVPHEPANSENRNLITAIAEFIEDVRLTMRQTTLLSDVTILLGLLLAAGASIKLAGVSSTSGSHRSAAHEIAERFATPDASGEYDERLDFAPRLRFWATTLTHGGQSQNAGANSESEDGTSTMISESATRFSAGHSQFGAYDALGLVVVRDLPAESTFSAGVRVSPTEWALAQADLKDLTLTLPYGAGPDVRAGIEIFDASGVAAGGMDLQIKRLPHVAAVNDKADDSAGNTEAARNRDGNIATGAIARKRSIKKPAAGGHSAKRLQVRARRLLRRSIAPKILAAPKPPAMQKATEQGLFALPKDSKSASLPLFAPAAETGKPVKIEGVGQGILINLGVFPRSPMEAEAMRR